MGYLLEHRLMLAARVVLATYDGQAPRHSYFDAMFQPRLARINVDAQGRQILTPAILAVLHRAASSACASVDGLVDGLMDTASMSVRPSPGECDIHLLSGETMYRRMCAPVPGGEQVGSAPAWAGSFVDADTAPLARVGIGADRLRSDALYIQSATGRSRPSAPRVLAGAPERELTPASVPTMTCSGSGPVQYAGGIRWLAAVAAYWRRLTLRGADGRLADGCVGRPHG